MSICLAIAQRDNRLGWRSVGGFSKDNDTRTSGLNTLYRDISK